MKTRRGLFGLIAGAAAVAGFGVAQAQIISPSRTTLWQPGVTYNGGIPNRATIYKTLSPIGGGADDTPQIQAALNGCPANQVVQLTAGVFNINGNGLNFTTPNCTLRGAGPGQGLSTGINGVATSDTAGTFRVDSTATQLIKADRVNNLSYQILGIGNDPTQFSTSINLASDAVQGTNSVVLASNPGIAVGEIIFIDMCTDNNSAINCTYNGSDVVYGPSFGPPGDGSRRWFMRQDRSLNQIMEVTAVNGNTITFATPFHYTYSVASNAQLSRFANPVMHGIGVEDIMFYGGMGGDWHGNVAMNLCAYCWVKHIEAFWSVGTSVGFYGTYRSELRDSYIHETPDANPGGAGYLIGLNFGASDNLIENNISWYGNKEIVMRATGGGNVVAYNYMDDTFDTTNPIESEAGVNAGHYTTPHMELIEGNYSQNFKGDSYWGNSIYITVFRNQLSGIRAAHSPLNTYKFNQGGCAYPYIDIGGRAAVDVQAYSFYHNIVGNVLGFSGQTLLSSPNNSCYDGTQGPFSFEELSQLDPGNAVWAWYIGAYQATVNTTGNWSWVANTYSTMQRDGNFDWVAGTQTWLGVGGTQSNRLGTPQAIPDSLYLSGKPPFFGSNAWPWVNPSNGSVTALPAKARFEAGTYNVILTGGSGTAPTVPANLAAAAVSSTSIGLTWTASTEAGGTVVGYQLSRNGVVVATPTGTSYTDSGLTPSTAYTYTVAAVDSNNNTSAQSSSASATTLAGSASNGVNLRGLMDVLGRHHVTAQNINIGVTSILTGAVNSGDANTLVGVKVSLAQSATVRSLSFYVLNAAGSLRLGIYDATGAGGNPGALKAQTNSFTPVAGWNTQNVVAPVSLPAGTYWLSYLPNNSNLSYPSGNTEMYACQSFTFGPMPATFPAITGCSGTLGWSFYATLSVP